MEFVPLCPLLCSVSLGKQRAGLAEEKLWGRVTKAAIVTGQHVLTTAVMSPQ